MVPKWKDQRGTFGVSLVFVHVAFSLLFFFVAVFGCLYLLSLIIVFVSLAAFLIFGFRFVFVFPLVSYDFGFLVGFFLVFFCRLIFILCLCLFVQLQL